MIIIGNSKINKIQSFFQQFTTKEKDSNSYHCLSACTSHILSHLIFITHIGVGSLTVKDEETEAQKCEGTS